MEAPFVEPAPPVVETAAQQIAEELIAQNVAPPMQVQAPVAPVAGAKAPDPGVAPEVARLEHPRERDAEKAGVIPQ